MDSTTKANSSLMEATNFHKTQFSILYVEDDMKIAQEVIFFLKKNGLHVIHAEDGKMGLEFFKSYGPDMVITEAKIPKLDGISMGKSIRKITPHLPIIMISTPNDSNHFLEAIDIGVDGCILKPIKLDTLLAKVQKVQKLTQIQKELQHANNLISEYQKVLDVSVILSKTNPKGIITYANDAFEKASGYSKAELIGANHNIIRHPSMPSHVFKELWRTIKNGQIWKGIIKNRRKDGGEYTVESTIVPILDTDGNIYEFIALRYDITKIHNYTISLEDTAKRNEALVLKKSQEMMEILLRDENTKLPNMLALKKALHEDKDGALMLFDIRNFSFINKLHGFSFGDTLLLEVSKHLSASLPKNAQLYKLSGDKFAIILDAYTQTEIENIYEQIFGYFNITDICINTIDTNIAFTMGATRLRGTEDVLTEAEIALEKAKKEARPIVFHTSSDDVKKEQSSIKNLYRVREYIKEGKITPWYQPIVDVKTGKIHKYEALARIVDNDICMTPNEFLPAATRQNLLITITKNMIQKACQQFQNTNIRFSINLSADDLREDYLVGFMEQKIDLYKIKPSQITFEILENLTLIENENSLVLDNLVELKNMGYSIAIDDFGSDRSNFARILTLQCDYLKIDGMFISGCDIDPQKRQIVQAISKLAQQLNIKTIAEFVSSESIYETIKTIGIDYAQGYYFGKPAPQIGVKY
jgi:PAS domain S-box-containing protein/diguanylate cyclase (GGDEF)-like protein